MTDDASPLRAPGWHQGSIVPAPLAEKLISERRLSLTPVPGQLFVVVSHDCDVQNASFGKEPYVELIRAVPRESDDGTLRYGRNPRKLLVDVRSRTQSRLFEISMHDRVFVDRRLLLGHAPDTTRALDSRTVRVLVHWIVKRYDRAAFPDAFNERLRRAHQRFRKTLARGGSKISGIYLKVENEEFPEGTDYHVYAEATMPVEAYEDSESRRLAQTCFDEVASAMEDCDGIVVSEHVLVSEGDFTFDELRQLTRWDWDDLSLREEPPSVLPPRD